MANTKSAAKRGRQSEKRNARNTGIRTGLKSAQKRFRSAIATGDKTAAGKLFREAVSELDKAAKRGVIHKNSADRRKGAFTRALAAHA